MTDGPHPFLAGAHPLAMAHRGGAGEATENSPATFQRVVELGFGWIETDTRATIDGHAVVFHDATLDRTTDACGELSALPWALVGGTRLADGAHPIALVDALRRWPEVRFNVDVKSDDTVRPFLAAVREADAWERVCAAAFSTARLNRLRALAGPRLATSMGPSEVARLILRAPGSLPAACAAQVPVAAGPIPVVTRSLVTRSHSRGLAVHVWTIDDPDQMDELLDLGVDGLITDHPTVLREVFQRRGIWR
ncbi:MAG: glycerophosphodiester phosphodiesterase family protein [Candidatus Nanopelagicales bacterium]